uniref:Transposable element P transposase-like C-terminal domain-containing protein n=1 Tax=Anopheles funestus TaxID=62324 RepID=A0A182RGV1_ANOFN
ITAQPLRDLVDGRLGSELTPLFKINFGHLVLSNQERQNVRRAAELLPHTTAVSLQWYLPTEKELANMIEIIDLWFSVSNSHNTNAKLHYKRSYTGSENQIKALDDMFEFISNMLVVGKNNMQIFQRSILMQINSLKMLFGDMKQKHNIVYLSTHKQHLLENFFSQLRQKGGTNDHPSPITCLYRIRLMILGKSPIFFKSVTDTAENSTFAEPDVFITTTGADENYNDQNVSQEHFVVATIFEGAEVVHDFETIETENELNSQNLDPIFNLNQHEQDGLEYKTIAIASLNLLLSICQQEDCIRHLIIYCNKELKWKKIFQQLHKDGNLVKTVQI